MRRVVSCEVRPKAYYSLDNFKFWTILSFLETKSRKEGILSIYIFLKG